MFSDPVCYFDVVDRYVIYLGLVLALAYQVMNANDFNSTRNNAPSEFLFMVFYLMFCYCYMVYYRVQFVVLLFPQFILILVGSKRANVALNVI